MLLAACIGVARPQESRRRAWSLRAPAAAARRPRCLSGQGCLPAHTSLATLHAAEEEGAHIRVGWAGPTVSLTTLAFRHALSSVETMPRNLVCVRV